MGAVATDEKQSVADELADARVLIVLGELDAALGRLAEARQRAVAREGVAG